jgi:hypothetical protein
VVYDMQPAYFTFTELLHFTATLNFEMYTTRMCYCKDKHHGGF